VSPPFQNFYQDGESIGIYKILKAVWEACKEDPEGCGRLLETIHQLGKDYAPLVVQAVRAAANVASVRALCSYVPPGYGPCPKEPSLIPYWPPANPVTIQIPTPPQPTVTIPVPQQPPVIVNSPPK
jgi:hypothetical protein